MKQIFTIALLLTACAIIISLVYNPLPFPALVDTEEMNTPTTVRIGDQIVYVEVARTAEERERGLSGHEPLEPEEGMLFVFPEDDTYSFWMKDMTFAIDIVWISHDGVIVDMRENVTPETYPTVFTPRTVARYVIELPAGYAEERGLSIGGRVEL